MSPVKVACTHGSEADSDVISKLHINQAGWARHRCVICSYRLGYDQAVEFGSWDYFEGLYFDVTSEKCQEIEKSIPIYIIDQLPISQADPGRHGCAICSFIAGFDAGLEALKSGEATQPRVRSISLPTEGDHDRNSLRSWLIGKILLEEPGTGTGEHASRYTYKVEDNLEGHDILLSRPARLKYGFDFVVCVDGFNFASGQSRTRYFPTLDEIILDLEQKKQTDAARYADLFKQIEEVFECKTVIVEETSPPAFSTGLPSKTLLGVLKWLLIEQDIRYWNYSGRAKFMSYLPRP